MKSIRIEGLRSLKDSGFVDIKPLTLLLGENSSGKSTFLRTFPLLRQSTESATRGPILWYGDYVDFGSFSDAVSLFSSEQKIHISFKIDSKSINKVTPHRYITGSGLAKGILEIKVTLAGDGKSGSSRVDRVTLNHNGNKAEISYSKTNKISNATINGFNLTDLFSGMNVISERRNYILVPYLSNSRDDYRMSNEYRNLLVEEKIIELIKSYAHGRSNLDDLLSRMKRTNNVEFRSFIDEFKNLSNTGTWKNRTNRIEKNCDKLKEIHANIFATRVPWILMMANIYISNEVSNVNYIAPLRATAERYYRNQELSVNEVDYQGKNLPMFINNLTDSKKKDFRHWMLDNFGFHLDAVQDGGHLALRVKYELSETSYNVTDMGFGFSQILPILTQLWFSGINDKSNYRYSHSTKYLIIEQPELHLHPRFQAKMIDAFIKMINLINNSEKSSERIRIIIETHSETIINQIGYRICSNKESENNGMIHNEDVSIVLFDKLSPNTPTEVSFSDYDKNGNLNSWPWGFFDPEVDL